MNEYGRFNIDIQYNSKYNIDTIAYYIQNSYSQVMCYLFVSCKFADHRTSLLQGQCIEQIRTHAHTNCDLGQTGDTMAGKKNIKSVERFFVSLLCNDHEYRRHGGNAKKHLFSQTSSLILFHIYYSYSYVNSKERIRRTKEIITSGLKKYNQTVLSS